jgi:hypothetical protein
LTNLGELLLYISEQSLFFLEYAPSFGFGDWVLYLGFLRWLLMLSRCLYILCIAMRISGRFAIYSGLAFEWARGEGNLYLSSITIGVSVSLAQYALLLLLLRASLK